MRRFDLVARKASSDIEEHGPELVLRLLDGELHAGLGIGIPDEDIRAYCFVLLLVPAFVEFIAQIVDALEVRVVVGMIVEIVLTKILSEYWLGQMHGALFINILCICILWH